MQSLQGLAERFFAEPERQAILAQPEPLRTESFFCCWTRKEAFLKAIGKGLTFPLSNVVVDVQRRPPVEIREIHDVTHVAAEWSLQHLEVEADYVAAMACRRQQHQIKLIPLASRLNVVTPSELLKLLQRPLQVLAKRHQAQRLTLVMDCQRHVAIFEMADG